MTSQPDEEIQADSLGEYIREARIRAGLSQRQLAKLAELHHSLIGRLESGEIAEQPKPENLQRIADALDIDSAELLTFLGIKPTPTEPKLFFRRAYGMTEAEAVEAEQVIANLREHMRERKQNKQT